MPICIHRCSDSARRDLNCWCVFRPQSADFISSLGHGPPKQVKDDCLVAWHFGHSTDPFAPDVQGVNARDSRFGSFTSVPPWPRDFRLPVESSPLANLCNWALGAKSRSSKQLVKHLSSWREGTLRKHVQGSSERRFCRHNRQILSLGRIFISHGTNGNAVGSPNSQRP